MKKLAIIFAAVSVFGFTACNKSTCHECHYDLNGTEVELGEYCDDDLTQIEADGYTDSTGTTHTVHCGEEH